MASSIAPPSNPAKDDLQQAAGLLHRFNAVSLGEGNLTAGGNTLAAMALTLANIAPPGSCLVDGEDGTRIPVGMNMLVSGGLSCSLISNRVIAPLKVLQDNLFAHIRQQVERRSARDKRVTEASAFLATKEDPPPPTVLDRLGKDSYFNEKHFEEELCGLLRAPANAGVSDITDSPVIFAGIGSVEGLNTTTGYAHCGRLLAHINLSGRNTGKLLNQVCDEVVSGCPKRKMLAASIRGEVIATDPTGALGNLVGEGSGHGWLERMLWLVDHAAGPEVEITAATRSSPQLSRPSECFEAALEEMVTRRINFHQPAPMRLEYPLTAGQAEWNAFLARLEPSFHGITGTLRPLRASLVFGLSRILNAAPDDGRPRLVHGEVEALARLLALRMANVRAEILDQQRERLIEALAAGYRLKLMEGPHTIRDLQRRTNNIDADTCRLAMERLLNRGDAVCRRGKWQLDPSVTPYALTLDA